MYVCLYLAITSVVKDIHITLQGFITALFWNFGTTLE